jgi:hypothetical protein
MAIEAPSKITYASAHPGWRRTFRMHHLARRPAERASGLV